MHSCVRNCVRVHVRGKSVLCVSNCVSIYSVCEYVCVSVRTRRAGVFQRMNNSVEIFK